MKVMSGVAMVDAPFAWDGLAVYKAEGRFLDGYPDDQRTFFAPQDNELTLSRNAVVAAETRAILDLNHDFMLKQMVGTKLDVTKLLAPKTGGATPPLPPAPAASQP
jgi:hypothetical protein